MNAETAKRIAREMVGLPWAELGTDPEGGLYCAAVVTEFYRRAGIEIDADPCQATAEAIRSDLAIPFRPVEKPEPGDVIEFAPDSGEAGHVGIFIPPSLCLHARRKSGVVLQRFAGARAGVTFHRLDVAK